MQALLKSKLKNREIIQKFYLKVLKIPINVKSKNNYDYIEVKGLNQFNSFNYKIPGDISSSSFFIVLTLLSKNSELIIKNVNVNESRIGIIKILNKMNAKIKFLNKKKYKGEKIADIFIKSIEIKSINCPQSLNSSMMNS